MYVLEYKQLYIVKEPMTKNRTCQSYRWKQYAISESQEALLKIKEMQKDPREWRVSKLAI